MITVYKYECSIGAFSLELPELYETLHVAEQNGRLVMWVKADTDNEAETVHFHAYGTGWPIDESDERLHMHVGTVKTSAGLLWHVFELWDITEAYK